MKEKGFDISVYDFQHPYEDEIMELEPPSRFYDPPENIVAPASLREPIIVKTVEELTNMIESIESMVRGKGSTEIAVDLEHYH